jgi:hypothetical protein
MTGKFSGILRPTYEVDAAARSPRLWLERCVS